MKRVTSLVVVPVLSVLAASCSFDFGSLQAGNSDTGVVGMGGAGGQVATTTSDAGAAGAGGGGSGRDAGVPDAPGAQPDVPIGGIGGGGGSSGLGGAGGRGDAGVLDVPGAQPDVPIGGTGGGGTTSSGGAASTGGISGVGGTNVGLGGSDAGVPDVPGVRPDATMGGTGGGGTTSSGGATSTGGVSGAGGTSGGLGGSDAGVLDAPVAQPDLPLGDTGGVVPYLLPTAVKDVYLGASSLVLDGTKAYITNVADTSLKVLDVSNPLNPTVLGSVNHGYSDSQLAAHVVYDNIVWIARSSCCGYGYATSIFGVDVSNPASPYVRGSLQLQTASSLVSWWSNLLVYSGYLLVQDYAQNKVYVIDISNPDAPTKFSEWSVPWMVDGGDAGMTINGHYLYMPCRQAQVLNIYDLTNLSAVTLAGSISTGSEEAWEWPVKIGAYLYMNVSTYGSGVVHMKVIDVSNPANPTIVGTVPSTGETIARNGKLFTLGTSGNNALASAYSLANPIAPVVEAATTVPPPPPTQTLNLWLMASPQTGWVGNYLIGMTYDETGNYSNSRIGAVYFPVN
jgi:hypothetical protein